MNETARTQRNSQRLDECFLPFATVLRRVLDTMEAQGFRPRIQDAWRSPEAQEHAVNTGKSKLRFGFHNATGAGGAKQALACDVLDDDSPLAPGTRYLLALAVAARAHGLDTGILWELSAAARAPVEAAIAAGNISAAVKVGFDPTHVEVTGITPAQARDGVRPTLSGTPSTSSTPPTGPATRIHVVRAGDTLSRIAQQNGLTLAQLLALNPQFAANPNKIRPGQEVRLG